MFKRIKHFIKANETGIWVFFSLGWFGYVLRFIITSNMGILLKIVTIGLGFIIGFISIMSTIEVINESNNEDKM